MMRFGLKTAAAALVLALIGPGGEARAAGALAIDGNKGDKYGFSYDHAEMRQAEQRALKECGAGCKVVFRFSSGCAAYAADQAKASSIYGWGTNANGPAAQDRALKECRAAGGASCTVRVWGCNSR